MTAFNVVRFKLKPGMEAAFLQAHSDVAATWSGLRHANIIDAGEGRYCIIAEWESMEAMAGARQAMIATLNGFRDTLLEVAEGKGVTDPASGPVVLAIK